jgi:hypothetical protein
MREIGIDPIEVNTCVAFICNLVERLSKQEGPLRYRQLVRRLYDYGVPALAAAPPDKREAFARQLLATEAVTAKD